MDVKFRLNQAATRRLLEERNGPVVLHVANKAREVRGAAKERVPVVSGKLRDSIDFEMVKTSRGWSAEVRAEKPYASWIEDGHRFDPRSGRTIFVKVGPRPFLRQAVDAVGLRLSRRRP